MLNVEYVPSGNVGVYQGEMLTMYQMKLVNMYRMKSKCYFIFIQKIESCDAVPLKNRIKNLVVLSLRKDGHGK